METLHPLAVHLPIALVLLWPLVDAAGLITGRRDVSATAVALLLLSIPASLLATVSGQAAYDAALAAGHRPELLDEHGDPAGYVPWLLLVLAVLRIAGVKRKGRPVHWASIALGLALAGLVIQVGAAGGELVYQHAVGIRAK
jgi:uncharacterized membrane protein